MKNPTQANGVQLRAAPADAPAPTAPDRVDRVLSFLTSALLLASVAALAFVCVPTLWQLTELQARQAAALEDREAAGADHEKTMRDLRRHALSLQVELTAQQETAKRLAAENLRLAEKLHRQLSGDN